MNENELRRLAKRTGFDVATLEKDYAITWLLSGIYSVDSKLKDVMIFKGGTALRKVFFPEWRLSEDLDFTILEKAPPEFIRQSFENVFRLLAEKSNITFSFDSFAPSAHAILADVQFVGPLGFKNRIAHDISLREKLIEKPEWRKISSGYDDIPRFKILVYSLNEILVEKIRSIFQRGKARDYYDVWRLLQQSSFDLEKIRELLVEKCRISGVEYKPDLVFDEGRLLEAKKFWIIALSRLAQDIPDFDVVVKDLKSRLGFMLRE